LVGNITIASAPVAQFELTPSNSFVGMPPFTVATVNQSTGGGLSYSWKISTNPDPLAPGFYTATTENISYEFTDAEITSFPSTFFYHLTVTDGAGLSSSGTQSVVFGAPPPLATFDLSPSSGSAPL